MPITYLALGSNLGNREKNIKEAILFLNKNKIEIQKVATTIETDPVGAPDEQKKYLNTVVEASTRLTPKSLLQTIHQIELQLGRVRSVKNAARTIDIDILLYDNVSIETDDLTIPHPRMWERDFVMAPLKEIAKHITTPDHL